MISNLIFDLDGTLFDSLEANIKSYGMAFKKAGLDFDSKQYQKIFGLRFNEMMDHMAPEADDNLRACIKKWKSEFYHQNLDLIRPHSDLLDFVEHSKKHFKTALVTTASTHNVHRLLKHFLGDKELFHAIVTGEDVSKGKPDPECYLLAFKKLAAEPSDCLVFEDTDVGIEAARRAGAKVIKVAM